MNKQSKLAMLLWALNVIPTLQAQNVVVVADSLGVSVEAEISYEDHRHFIDNDAQPVFRVYEHNSASSYVDVPTHVDKVHSTSETKKGPRTNVSATEKRWHN